MPIEERKALHRQLALLLRKAKEEPGYFYDYELLILNSQEAQADPAVAEGVVWNLEASGRLEGAVN